MDRDGRVSAIITGLCKEFAEGSCVPLNERCVGCIGIHCAMINCMYIGHKKSAPDLLGGQLALVLSSTERCFGGLGSLVLPGRSSPMGGGLRTYGRSAPVEEDPLWGNGPPWAAKLFSINRTCTVLLRTRAAGSSVEDAALPRATMCIR